MDINFRRIDNLQVGLTSKRCMTLLPATEKNGTQKFVVGGQDGVLACFGRKKNENQVIFKTLPAQKIECLSLGGAVGSVQDKIFVAMGPNIKGFSKKGRQFFSFETNMTENISSFFIYGVEMMICGSYSFTHYHDCIDTSYFLCGDKINDVLCLPITEGGWVGRGLTPVLACDDRTIKVLDGSKLSCEVQLGGVPNVLHLFQNVGGSEGNEVLYGTKDGKLGLIEIPPGIAKIKWEIVSTSGAATVTCIDCYDITGDGQLDLIAGRDDGIIEIYVYDITNRPTLKQIIQCNESLTSLKCGRVNSPYYDEIVVSTYGGWLYSYTTEPAQKELAQASTIDLSAAPTFDPETEKQIQALRIEIEDLQKRITTERDRYQQNTQAEGRISAVPVFSINAIFKLNQVEAAYDLCIELQVPMDYLLLQCDVPIDLLDVDRNSAVVSLTPCEPGSGNALLATYRCQANTTRLDLKLRSIEGQYGTLQVYVAPRISPKSCQVRQFPIKPLSLHQRCHTFDETRPFSTLKLTGNFTIAEAHSWVYFCLPELPEKPPVGEKITFQFVSTFISTQLECSYTKGLATFRSDSISTIAILRDVLSKEMTKRKTRLDMSCDVNDESVAHTLRLVHPKLEYQLNLAKKVQLIEALRELTVHENDASFLSEEYIDLLKTSNKIEQDFKGQQAHLERIYGIITDLYIDKFKFKGINVRSKIPQLLQLLNSNYSSETLLKFFDSPH